MKTLLLAAALLMVPAFGAALTATPVIAAATTRLGDLSEFSGVATSTLALVDKGDLPAAKQRITDFETIWDINAARLRVIDPDAWGVIDDAADAAIAALRANKPTTEEARSTVTALIATLR